MAQILLRAVLVLGAWAIGLALAAWVVPGVSVSASGFIVAVVVFSVAHAIVSLALLKLPSGYASLFLGGTALVLTLVAFVLASAFTHGFRISGLISWVGATFLVWLVATIPAVVQLFVGDKASSSN